MSPTQWSFAIRPVRWDSPSPTQCCEDMGGSSRGPGQSPARQVSTWPLSSSCFSRSTQKPAGRVLPSRTPPQKGLQAPLAGQTPGRRKEGFTQNQDFGEARGSPWGKACQAGVLSLSCAWPPAPRLFPTQSKRFCFRVLLSNCNINCIIKLNPQKRIIISNKLFRECHQGEAADSVCAGRSPAWPSRPCCPQGPPPRAGLTHTQPRSRRQWSVCHPISGG